MSPTSICPTRRDSGAVLITGLIFMTLMMLIAVAVVRNATLEERMASNARNRQLALEATEAVVRDAESTLFDAPPFEPYDQTSFTAGCTMGLCDGSVSARWKTTNWDDATKTRSFANPAFTLAGLPNQPRYIVEQIGQDGGQRGKLCPRLLFRIVGRGLGADGSEVFIEDIYRFRPEQFADGTCG